MTQLLSLNNAIKSYVDQYIAANRVDATSRDLTRLYATATTVGAVANLRADMLAQIPLVPHCAGKPVEDATHPLVRMFRPGAALTDLMRRTELTLYFWGRNLVWKQRNVFQRTQSLRWINPNVYALDALTTVGLRGFRIYPSSRYQVEPISYVDLRDAIYVHEVDFDDDFDGVSDIERAFLEASVEPEMAQTVLAVFRNMAIPAAIAQPAADGVRPQAEDVTAMKNFLARIVRGALNAGKTLISPGRWEWIQLQQPFKDMELGSIREEARLAICVGSRVPLELIVPSAANYAQFEGARRTWGQAWAVPRIRWYASQFTEQLAKEWGEDWTIEPDLEAVDFLKEDAVTRIQTVNAKVTGTLITLYQAQQEIGDTPDEALKDLYMVSGMPVPKSELTNLWRTQFAPAPATAAPSPFPASMPAAATGTPTDAAPAAEKDGGESLCILLDLSNNPDLMALQQRLRQLYPDAGVEWNAPDSLHVTCFFAPSVSEVQMAAVTAALDGLELPDLVLGVGSLNSFDNLGNYTLHFRIKQNADLLDFQEALYDLCVGLGVVPSAYSLPANFKPHVTMGYAKARPQAVTFASKITVRPMGLMMTAGDMQHVVWRSQPVLPDASTSKSSQFVPDAQWKELKDWEALTARKGTDYAFQSTALPRSIRDYVQVGLADGDGPHAFAEARALLADSAAVKSYADTEAAFTAEIAQYFQDAAGSDIERRAFASRFRSALRRAGLMAFRDGMESEGYTPESLGANELAVFRAWQDEVSARVTDVGAEIYKGAGLSDAQAVQRPEMWANASLRQVFYQGAVLAAADKPKTWKRDPQKDSCPDCKERDGQTKTYAEWAKSGLPGAFSLKCHGVFCGCTLEDA